MFRGPQHSGSTGTPRKGKWRRRLLRAALGLVALLFLGCAFLFYGWRYGFRPLPEPLTGPEAARPALPALAEVGPGNYWYWPQALQKHIPTEAFEAEVLIQTAQEWCRYGWVDQTNRVLLREWIQGQPGLTEAYLRALQATNSLARFPRIDRQVPQWHERLLRAYAVWLALEAEQEGRIPETMDRLVEAWHLEASSASFPINYRQHMPQRIDQVWRRLLLSTPDLPLDRLQAWQEGLAAVRRSLAPLAETYEGVAVETLNRLIEDDFNDPLDFNKLGGALRQAVSGMLSGGVEVLAVTFKRFLGENPGSISEGADFRELAEFAQGLVLALGHVLAWRCARPEDGRRVIEAVHTRTLRSLRQTNLIELRQLQEGIEVRWWDRPAAWSMWRYPTDGFPLVSDRRQWRAPLTSCQLTLALRVFREQTGNWPNGLDDLCPNLPSEALLDPLGGAPLHYRTDGQDWDVTLTPRINGIEWYSTSRVFTGFHSREDEVTFHRFTYSLFSHGLHRTNDWLLPALKRYGIVEGVESVTHAVPVITNLIFQIQEHRALGLTTRSGPSYGLPSYAFPGWGLPSPRQVLPILQTMRVHPSSLTNLTLPVSSRFPSREYDDRDLLRRKASPPPPPL